MTVAMNLLIADAVCPRYHKTNFGVDLTDMVINIVYLYMLIPYAWSLMNSTHRPPNL